MKIENTPTLETSRLRLRKFTENDVSALYELLSCEEVNKFLPWFPVKNPQEAREFYKRQYEDVYAKERGYQYAVCMKSDDLPVGYVKVDVNDSYDLGYALRKEYWHKGIVTEASKAIAARVKADGVPYITATHDVLNPRSGNVMKALGMQYRYSYKEQWQPKNISVIFRMYQLNFDGNDERIYKKYWDMYDEHFIETEI